MNKEDEKLRSILKGIDSKPKPSLEEIKQENKERKEKNSFIQLRNDCWQFIMTKQEEYATEELVRYIESKNKIYSTRDDVKSEMWIYEDGIYQPNGESLIREITRKVLLHAYTPQRANKVIAKIQADTFIEANNFFDVKYIDEICVLNGILNLKTRELSPFTPEKIFFNKIPVEYNSEAKCEKIDKFFSEVLKSSDDKKVIYELFGFCLHKEYFLEKAFMFKGSGRNGKSKTLTLLKEFLGVENSCSVRLNQMNENSSALCELHNRLVNIAGDLSNTSLKDTGIFKELTGRDPIQVKRKYLRDLMFTNYAKIVFACNDLPRIYDLSEGFWSRWVLLEFPYQFLPQNEINQKSEEEKKYCKVQDPSIIEKLVTKEEFSGLLNEALNGLDRIKKKKDFSYSKGTTEVKDFWVRKSDSFTAFCIDHIIEDIEGYESKKRIRKEFNRYCKKHKVKGTSDTNIKVVLQDMFGVNEGRKQILGQDDRDMVWEGIKFIEKKEKVKGVNTFSENPRKLFYKGSEKPLDTLDFNEIVSPICPNLSFSSTSSTSSTPLSINNKEKGGDEVVIDGDKEKKKVVMVAIDGDDVDTWKKEDLEKAGYSEQEIEELKDEGLMKSEKWLNKS